jgi:DNA-binding NarL/FixJ family response regulator
MTEKNKNTIIVVDDEVIIAIGLEERLTEMGYDVVGVVHSGEEAVEKAMSLRPDLILMDIMLPGNLDGISAAKIVKARWDIPVVFLSAFSEDKIIEKAKQAEPYGFIIKPFQVRELKAAIEVALYKKGMEQRLKESEIQLQKAHDELERRVENRTRKLRTTLKIMKRNEKEIVRHKSSLEKVNRELMETNQALSVLARNIDRDKEFLEKKIYETTSVNIMPIIKELQNDTNCQKHQADLEVISTYLNSLISGPTDHHDIIISLTDQEMRVAVMIKNNLTSQKIATMLYISLHTVKTHRKNIRKKLNIQNSTVNLASYLKSYMPSVPM